MTRFDDIYARLLASLRRKLPDIAEQIEAEVRRGKRLTAKKLPQGDEGRRDLKLKEGGWRLTKEDVASVPYTSEERVRLLLESLRRLRSSMIASREATHGVLQADGIVPEVTLRTETGSEPTTPDELGSPISETVVIRLDAERESAVTTLGDVGRNLDAVIGSLNELQEDQ